MNLKSRLTNLEKLHTPGIRRELTEEMEAALLEISLALGTEYFDDLHIPPPLLEKAEPTAKFLSIHPALITFGAGSYLKIELRDGQGAEVGNGFEVGH